MCHLGASEQKNGRGAKFCAPTAVQFKSEKIKVKNLRFSLFLLNP